MVLDPSIAEQKYVEDCEVCCNPVEVIIVFKEDVLQHFEAKTLEQ